MKHFAFIKSMRVVTLAAGVLLVIFGGFRIGLQSLWGPETSLLNPVNIGCLAAGAAFLVFSLAVSLMIRAQGGEPRRGQKTDSLPPVKKR